MKRLLLDQGLPRSTSALLIGAGWDLTHVSEIGMSRADDVDILLANLLQAVWPDIEVALAAGAMVTVTDRAIRVRRLSILKN